MMCPECNSKHLGKVKEAKSEAEIQAILAHHLFSQLAPTGKYVIDGRCAPVDLKKCPACKADLVYGDTSIGKGKRKADDDGEKKHSRQNKSTKTDSCIEIVKIEKKASKQRKRHASDREGKQVGNNPPNEGYSLNDNTHSKKTRLEKYKKNNNTTGCK
ncbi:unnamed protein product [Mytilus coruscus]|uniref:Uncharacterized protein n=1 Tax=Mytilus coruscus TaxID=42192 RepID=A0A6J8A3X0_MYTCO|nr:unnamed protein product [Mytilus coruscus]